MVSNDLSQKSDMQLSLQIKDILVELNNFYFDLYKNGIINCMIII